MSHSSKISKRDAKALDVRRKAVQDGVDKLLEVEYRAGRDHCTISVTDAHCAQDWMYMSIYCTVRRPWRKRGPGHGFKRMQLRNGETLSLFFKRIGKVLVEYNESEARRLKNESEMQSDTMVAINRLRLPNPYHDTCVFRTAAADHIGGSVTFTADSDGVYSVKMDGVDFSMVGKLMDLLGVKL